MGERGLNVAAAEAYVDDLLHRKQTAPRKKPVYVIKDVRLFLNSVTRGMDTIRRAGVDAQCRREDSEEAITLTIRIPGGGTPTYKTPEFIICLQPRHDLHTNLR